jgi:hypothetical protein
MQAAALAFITAQLVAADTAEAAERVPDVTQCAGSAQPCAQELLDLLRRVAANRPDNDVEAPPIAILRHAEVLLRTGKPEHAALVLDKALQGRSGSHWELWDLRLRMVSAASIAVPAATPPDTAQRLVAAALLRVCPEGRWRLLPRCLSSLLACGGSVDVVLDAMKALLRTPAVTSISTGAIAAAVLGAVRCVLADLADLCDRL